MKRKVPVGVITAAGRATRMWPASKVCPKELFPLGKVPILVYIIWELMDAGIERIVIVAGQENAGAIRQLLDPAIKGPEKFVSDPLVRRFSETLDTIGFTVIEQSGPYGNGTPLINAGPCLGNDPCIYAFADDIILGENISAGLIHTYVETDCPVMSCQSVEEHRKPALGILECTTRSGVHFISRFVEKPAPGTTTSNLASLGRYLVTPELRGHLAQTKVGRAGELWFADSVINMLGHGEPVCALPLSTGRWFTVGDPDGFADAVAAMRDLSWNYPEIRSMEAPSVMR